VQAEVLLMGLLGSVPLKREASKDIIQNAKRSSLEGERAYKTW
jgi:hypothetical protein